MALKAFLDTIKGETLARNLRWSGSISHEQGDRRYSSYASGFEIRGSDGVVTKTSRTTF